MRAFRVITPGRPLQRSEDAEPEPGPGELLLRVRACGVCRTDLHVADGDLPVHRAGVIPGHEVVGEVVDTGERRGVAWLRGTCGQCSDSTPAITTVTALTSPASSDRPTTTHPSPCRPPHRVLRRKVLDGMINEYRRVA